MPAQSMVGSSNNVMQSSINLSFGHNSLDHAAKQHWASLTSYHKNQLANAIPQTNNNQTPSYDSYPFNFLTRTKPKSNLSPLTHTNSTLLTIINPINTHSLQLLNQEEL